MPASRCTAVFLFLASLLVMTACSAPEPAPGPPAVPFSKLEFSTLSTAWWRSTSSADIWLTIRAS